MIICGYAISTTDKELMAITLQLPLNATVAGLGDRNTRLYLQNTQSCVLDLMLSLHQNSWLMLVSMLNEYGITLFDL